jgi:hypothetical protein
VRTTAGAGRAAEGGARAGAEGPLRYADLFLLDKSCLLSCSPLTSLPCL